MISLKGRLYTETSYPAYQNYDSGDVLSVGMDDIGYG